MSKKITITIEDCDNSNSTYMRDNFDTIHFSILDNLLSLDEGSFGENEKCSRYIEDIEEGSF